MALRPIAILAALAASLGAACERAAPPPAAAPAPPAAEAAKPYQLRVEPPAGARAGQPATGRVVVEVHGDYHVNRDYPVAFRPDPASVGAFGAERLPLAEAAERTPCASHPGEACTLAAPLRFTPAAAGPLSVSGTLAFSVCNPQVCLIEKVPVALQVAVAP